MSPFIKADSIFCGYARESLSNEEFAHLRPEELEYALSIIFRGVFHYNAYQYDGHNIGRYINQGGLRQALDKLLSMARVGGGGGDFNSPMWRKSRRSTAIVNSQSGETLALSLSPSRR